MTNESERVLGLASAWLQGDIDGLMYDACSEEPEIALKAILEILKHDISEDQIAILAAGPLEDVIVKHGPGFIDRIEQEAKVNSRFNYALGGVWRRQIPVGIWERLEKVRKKVW